jgi:uncharacterized membrane protein
VSLANPEWPDESVDRVIGNILRAGVVLAAAIVLIGAVIYLARHGTERADQHTFHGEPENLRNPERIVAYALQLHGRGVIQLGVLLLIATPVIRVIFAAFAFAWQRDWTYVTVSLLVLAVLMYSLFHGQFESPRAAASPSAGPDG